ncbi:MAG: hypothetical protein ABIE70_03580 [bacterium]
MRSEKRLLVSGLVALVALMPALVGCSSDSDKTPTGTTDPVQGSLDDPSFVAVRAQIDAFADSTVTFFRHGLNALQGIDDAILPPQYAVDPGGQGTIESDYSNGWHVIGLDDLQTSLHVVVIDSIQFLKNGHAQQTPYGVHQMVFKHHWYSRYAGEVSEDTTVGLAEFRFGDFYAANTSVSGSATISYDSEPTTGGSYHADITAELSGFKLDQSAWPGWQNGFQDCSSCPAEGTINATAVVTAEVAGGATITATWNVELTFDDGVMSAEITANNTIWNYSTQVCNVDGN